MYRLMPTKVHEFKGHKFVVPEVAKWSPVVYGEVFTSRVYDCEEMGVKVEPGDVVLDVGANVGFFTVYALMQDASKVYAVEPEKTCAQCIRGNAMLYGVEDRVVVLEGAAWSAPGTLVLNSMLDKNIGSHFIEEAMELHGWWRGNKEHGKQYQVKALRLDEEIKEKIDFVKMDIEGSEREAIKGLEGILKAYRPKLAITTYHRKDDDKVIPELIRSMVPEYKLKIVQHPTAKVLFGKV